MSQSKLRRQIAWEAACLMYQHQETEYFQAKLKAAQRICRGWVKPNDLPSNAEIRDEVQMLARLYEGDKRLDDLREMRIAALFLMRQLDKFRPRLIGSVLTGHVRAGSDIDLHVFSDSVEGVASVLDDLGMIYEVERKRVLKDGLNQIFIHIHVRDRWPVEITVYPARMVRHTFTSSITGKAIERATVPQLEEFLKKEYSDLDLSKEVQRIADRPDRFRVYESLLLPLENVKQSPKFHPEGDVLYHSLQVFDLARDASAYDEDFLLAALLHDVGKGIDPEDHVGSGLEALQGYISDRTEWLIAHHMDAQLILDHKIGARRKRRLQESEFYEDLLSLARCDRDGRVPGYQAPDLDEALDYLREIAETFGG
jgi:hypothetical protein